MPTLTVTKSPRLARPVKNMKPTMTTAITATVFAKVPVTQVLIFSAIDVTPSAAWAWAGSVSRSEPPMTAKDRDRPCANEARRDATQPLDLGAQAGPAKEHVG